MQVLFVGVSVAFVDRSVRGMRIDPGADGVEGEKRAANARS